MPLILARMEAKAFQAVDQLVHLLVAATGDRLSAGRRADTLHQKDKFITAEGGGFLHAFHRDAAASFILVQNLANIALQISQVQFQTVRTGELFQGDGVVLVPKLIAQAVLPGVDETMNM